MLPILQREFHWRITVVETNMFLTNLRLGFLLSSFPSISYTYKTGLEYCSGAPLPLPPFILMRDFTFLLFQPFSTSHSL